MAFTYDLSTGIGRVRLYVPDNQETSNVFEDEEIAAFLEAEGENPKLAAALALEVMASSEAYKLKAVRVLDMQTDGTKVSVALLSRAAKLREQGDEEADDSIFEIAEWADTPFNRREILRKKILSGGL